MIGARKRASPRAAPPLHRPDSRRPTTIPTPRPEQASHATSGSAKTIMRGLYVRWAKRRKGGRAGVRSSLVAVLLAALAPNDVTGVSALPGEDLLPAVQAEVTQQRHAGEVEDE